MAQFDKKRERRNFWYFGVGFAAIIAVVLFKPNPSDFQQLAIRWFASIMAAGVGYNIPGLLSVNWRSKISTNVDMGIKASGAIAIFVIIYLVNPPAMIHSTTLTLTVRASSASEPRITRGAVRVFVEDYNYSHSFADDGDATFKDFPRKYFGQQAEIFPDVPGYSQEPITQTIERAAINVTLVPPKTHIEGRVIFPPSIKVSDLKIFAGGTEGTLDPSGKFDIPLHETGSIDVKLLLRNKVVYDRTHAIPGPVTISVDARGAS